ncbi:hypothetical protein SPWS13_4582 [Shewanella putrefaciens]|nr:hypothetical protein SPWS13_2354 [Shewanella putrefaciens]AVV84836.1 hypothetical protein SPWS13_3096 [Shewanella putrefaciens]AVV86247.1 hypothetical protein SPWS13_4582 [Shewanella putrefaciens]
MKSVHSNMYKELIARLIRTEFVEPKPSGFTKTLIEEFDHGSD